MRISDWSSDVCSSDLLRRAPRFGRCAIARTVARAEFLEPINICCRLLQPLRGSDNQQKPTPVSREAYPREEAGPRKARGGYSGGFDSPSFDTLTPQYRC